MDTEEVIAFKRLKHINKTECLKCGKKLSGLNRSNITRHYKLIHKININKRSGKAYEANENSEKKPKRSSDEATQAAHDDDNDDDQATLKIASISCGIGAATTSIMDKSEFLKCCVGMVIANDIPISILDDDEFFKPLIAPYETKFGTNLNSSNFATLLECANAKIRQSIASRVQHKIVSLKLDLAENVDASVLVINIQYIRNYKICIDSLGVIPHPERYKPNQLRQKIRDCLALYHIDIEHIYTSTIDSVVSFTQSFEKIDDPQEEQSSEINVHPRNSHIQTALAPLFSAINTTAQIIQFAAQEVLVEVSSHLNECRCAVRKLQQSIEEGTFDASVKPVLDNIVHWQSTLEMLETLLKIKDAYAAKQLEIQCELDWDFIVDFMTAFSVFAEFAKLPHHSEEQFVVGDFYRDWLNCELELEELFSMTPYAATLYEAMQTTRKKWLFQNDAFIAALYLDPRFNFCNSYMLTEDQKLRAVTHLTKTYKLMQGRESEETSAQTSIKSTHQNHTESFSECSNHSMDTSADETLSTSHSPYAKLERHIKNLLQMKTGTDEAHQTFEQRLSALLDWRRVPLETNILDYWQLSNINADVKKVAQAVLAIPINQASLERAFIVLSIITKSEDDPNANLPLIKLNLHELNAADVKLEFTGN